MSLLETNLDSLKTASQFQFSAANLSALGASEYTLVVLAVDASSSVASFSHELENMIRQSIGACQKSDRKENLMVRLIEFSDDIREIHGFKQLGNVSVDDYKGVLHIGGLTALCKAGTEAVESVATYGKQLMDQEILANAIVFIITDGADNASGPFTEDSIRDAIRTAQHDEVLESINTVLIGVNTDTSGLNAYLDAFKNKVGITQYVDAGSATPGKLAKLAQFVSKSISSTSQALGSGGASQPISFTV